MLFMTRFKSWTLTDVRGDIWLDSFAAGNDSLRLPTLTADPLTPGHAWAFNVVRVIPNGGVQSFSQPAEAPEEALRLEGMGLLMFMEEAPLAPAKYLMPEARP
jgi:hypothetical protein